MTDAARQPISRRALVGGGLAFGGLLLAGCAPSPDRPPSEDQGSQATPGVQKTAMTVYRDPSCGCCESWANIARQEGYEVSLLDNSDMGAVKKRLGVPEELASCHTATVDNFVIEGHVPMEDVARLLAGPSTIKGIAVPGMPAGSPGMEVPDGTKQPFQVIAFDAQGSTSVYNSYGEIPS